MQINLDTLIEAVNNCNSYTERYKKTSKKWYKLEESERTSIYEKYNMSDSALFDMCNLIGADAEQVRRIFRAVRKWEQKNNWELIFPAMKNYDKILNYIINAN